MKLKHFQINADLDDVFGTEEFLAFFQNYYKKMSPRLNLLQKNFFDVPSDTSSKIGKFLILKKSITKLKSKTEENTLGLEKTNFSHHEEMLNVKQKYEEIQQVVKEKQEENVLLHDLFRKLSLEMKETQEKLTRVFIALVNMKHYFELLGFRLLSKSGDSEHKLIFLHENGEVLDVTLNLTNNSFSISDLNINARHQKNIMRHLQKTEDLQAVLYLLHHIRSSLSR